MATATTLALGSASYELLDALSTSPNTPLSAASNVAVTKSGASTLLRNTLGGNAAVEGFGIGDAHTDNLTVRGNFENLSAALGNNNDRLNLLGNIVGTEILLDLESKGFESNTGNDALTVEGSLIAGGNFNDLKRNQIWAGGGKDNIKLNGIVEDTDIYLGSGDDTLLIGKAAERVHVGADVGRDNIEFRGTAADVVVQSGQHNDTVVFRDQLYGSGNDVRGMSSTGYTSGVDLGLGDDALILGKGAANAEINTGAGLDSVRLTGTFENSRFHLDGSNNLSGGDQVTISSNARFTDVVFSSNNSAGDSFNAGTGIFWNDSELLFGSGLDKLAFGSGSTFIDSTFSLGDQSDSLSFGSGSIFDNSLIDLGNDQFADLVRFGSNADLSGITIRGAGQGDILFIGDNKYSYMMSSVTDDLFESGTSNSQEWMKGWFRA